MGTAGGGSDDESSSSASSSNLVFPLEEDSGGTEEPELRIMTFKRLARSKLPATLNRWAEDTLGLSLMMLLLRLATAAWVVTGVFALTQAEGEQKDTITTIYLLVQIITTIGYGDITPESRGMQLFMAFYVLVGNVITALVITEWLHALIAKSHTDAMNHRMRKIVRGGEMRGDQGDSPYRNSAALAPNGYSALAPNDSGEPCDTSSSLLERLSGPFPAFVIYMCFILLGALYYGMVDNCVCTDIWDCSRGEGCEDSGGHVRTVCDGFYMAAITLTTIGYGDELPESIWGRIFCIFWMVLGVASMANFSAELAHIILRQNMQTMAEHDMSHETFQKIDADGSGSLSRYEFITYMLVNHGLISESDLDTLLLEFEKLDLDGSGELTYEEVNID